MKCLPLPGLGGQLRLGPGDTPSGRGPVLEESSSRLDFAVTETEPFHIGAERHASHLRLKLPCEISDCFTNGTLTITVFGTSGLER
jgi:hypothetical protein